MMNLNRILEVEKSVETMVRDLKEQIAKEIAETPFIYQYDTNKSETIKLGKGNNPILLEQKYIKKVS